MERVRWAGYETENGIERERVSKWQLMVGEGMPPVLKFHLELSLILDT